MNRIVNRLLSAVVIALFLCSCATTPQNDSALEL